MFAFTTFNVVRKRVHKFLKRFHQVHDHRQRLFPESCQRGCPRHSVDFLSAFRNVRQNCTVASSSSLRSPSSSPSSTCPDKLMDVEGKCALIVDGTSGVGFAFANELLKMKAAKVVITGLDEHKGAETACELNERYGPAKAVFYRTDITNPLEVENMFKYTKNQFATLDIFFNNAETYEDRDAITTNFVSKIQGIILASKNMKDGSIIVNHTSALALDPNSEIIAHGAASAGFLVASMAFSKNKYFKKTQIRMMTLCSELMASMSIGGTVPFICDGHEAHKNIQIAVAKSAAYLVKYGPNNTLWLCQQNGILSLVMLHKIDEFTVKYEPSLIISDRK